MRKSVPGKAKLAAKVLKHINKDSKEFRGQLADDAKLAKQLRKASKHGKK